MRGLKDSAFAVLFRVIGAGLLAAPTVAAGGGVSQLVGLDDLIARVGEENVPTGATQMVAQVEAGNPGSYGPDQTNDEFENKSFIGMSGTPGSFGHATTVAANYYGNFSSIAPGVATIYLWTANDWATSGFLNTGASGTVFPDPLPAAISVLNNSWVGTFQNNAIDNDALRRTDFAINRDELMIVSGVNNGGTNYQLMSHTFNGIAVGVMSGGHTSGDTLEGIDGPGRMIPELVAPNSQTSFSTPVVSAAAALMKETAEGIAAGESNAVRSDVIKAVLMAGANHRDGWTNNPAESGPERGVTDRPLDEVFGADLVNVDTGHMILTGGEHDGAMTPPADRNVSGPGWDLASVEIGASRYYRFSISQPAEEISILATWHRRFGASVSLWWIADFDLILWRVEGNGDLVTLVGDAGLSYFDSGNVVSESAVDNVEHLYIGGLQPGVYVVELQRIDAIASLPVADVAIAWHLPGVSAADLDGDGSVGILDLLLLLELWGPCPQPPDPCPGDLDGDGIVGTADLLVLIASWT